MVIGGRRDLGGGGIGARGGGFITDGFEGEGGEINDGRRICAYLGGVRWIGWSGGNMCGGGKYPRGMNGGLDKGWSGGMFGCIIFK